MRFLVAQADSSPLPRCGPSQADVSRSRPWHLSCGGHPRGGKISVREAVSDIACLAPPPLLQLREATGYCG